MSRVLSIIALVGLLMATGVAVASPVNQTRVPITVDGQAEQATRSETVVVEKGDHLWKISARHLGDGAGVDEITPYWRVVVEVNTPRLKSGDPDLIFPGEIVQLPASPGQP